MRCLGGHAIDDRSRKVESFDLFGNLVQALNGAKEGEDGSAGAPELENVGILETSVEDLSICRQLL